MAIRLSPRDRDGMMSWARVPLPGCGQPAQGDGKKQDQHDSQPEMGHGQTKERAQHGGEIPDGSALDGREDSQGDGNHERDQHGGPGQLKARRKPSPESA